MSPLNYRTIPAFKLVRAGGWLAVTAFVMMCVLTVAEVCLREPSPFLGLFAFLVAPVAVGLGLALTAAGWALAWLAAWRRGHHRHMSWPVLPPTRMSTGMLSFCSMGLIGLVGMSGYRGYHYAESVPFCGQVCHDCMKPELTAFVRSGHAHLACADCHVGPGVEWMVRTKLAGLRMTAHQITGKYERPVRANLDEMRPPEETCGRCHVAQHPREARRVTRTYFRGDESNTAWTVDMLVEVGGANGGAHWHSATNRKIEFIATDRVRNSIPWVRMTDANGKVTVFQTKNTNDQLSAAQVTAATPHAMNCLDCHNRVGHEFQSPERAVNAAFAAGRLDASRKALKVTVCTALTNSYASPEEAEQSIESALCKAYPGCEDEIKPAVAEAKRVYRQNFFPAMKADWKAYPDNIGHMTSPGCFRCHDGRHVSEAGQVIRHDCDLCHTFIAQGKGVKLSSLTSPGGLKFDHPEDLGNKPMKDQCSKCHKGVPIL